MASETSDVPYLAPGITTSVKIVVLGPFAVGKTTYVTTVSEIQPLSTEEVMTVRGEAIDDLHDIQDKTTTTVAMDFGRLSVTDDIVLYIFGAPGQPRYHHLLHGLMQGALGGVVLADTRRIEESFPSIERLEKAGVPYAVAINDFPDAPRYSEADLRDAFSLDPHTPLVVCDARDRPSAKHSLIALVSHLLYLNSLR